MTGREAGCEALAVSGFLRRRDDQAGCASFLPTGRPEAAAVITADRDDILAISPALAELIVDI